MAKMQKGILHLGYLSGPQPTIARAQRALGHRSDLLAFNRHPFGYEVDDYYPLDGSARSLLGFLTKHSIDILGDYSILHFHVHSLTQSGMDVAFLRALAKKVIIHHHGSELRYWGEKNTYNRFANRILVSTPDLLRWSPGATYLPNPIDLNALPNVGVEEKPRDESKTVVHAPSRRGAKGTESIIRAIERLKEEGLKIDLALVENMPYAEALESYKRADIIIDQICELGIYGMVSIEAMALGKPVLCSINRDYEDYFPSLPIMSATKEDLESKLRMMIEDVDLRCELGRRGRKYVESVHDSARIAHILDEIYDI